jgi:hypothetical protein
MACNRDIFTFYFTVCSYIERRKNYSIISCPAAIERFVAAATLGRTFCSPGRLVLFPFIKSLQEKRTLFRKYLQQHGELTIKRLATSRRNFSGVLFETKFRIKKRK